MEEISQFFRCCRSSSNEAQLLVTMREKPRESLHSTPTKKTFIKRSASKISSRDLEGKNSNHTTLRTLRASSHTRDNRKKGLDLSPQTHESFDSLGDNFYPVNTAHQQWGWPLNSDDFRSTRHELQKFINYYQYNSTNNSFNSLSNSNCQLFQLNEQPQFKVAVPRLLANQKAYRQDSSNSHKNSIHWQPYAPVLKTILETIDEKSSVPSMQDSQAFQLRQISSRATLKSNILDKKSQSPNTDKFQSIMIMQSHSRQSLKLANSQNLPSHQQFDREEKERLNSSNRLFMDIQLLLRELKTLQEQERMLLRQREFNKMKFQQDVNALEKASKEYREKNLERKRELFELGGLYEQLIR